MKRGAIYWMARIFHSRVFNLGAWLIHGEAETTTPITKQSPHMNKLKA